MPHEGEPPSVVGLKSDLQPLSEAEQVEDIRNISQDASPPGRGDREYPVQPESVPDTELPFISPLDVTSKRHSHVESNRETVARVPKTWWIVVDNIVYDCTEFAQDHPGGLQVILSFVGEDCSWQFWRFHGKKIMEQYGKPLRVGRTRDIINRFEERPKYIGLSRLSRDEW